MYISQPGLCAALPGNKAEMESHREKTLWSDPPHPSPHHSTTEAPGESDSSYVHACAYVKIDFVCIFNKMHVCACVCVPLQYVMGIWFMQQANVCVYACACVRCGSHGGGRGVDEGHVWEKKGSTSERESW